MGMQKPKQALVLSPAQLQVLTWAETKYRSDSSDWEQ